MYYVLLQVDALFAPRSDIDGIQRTSDIGYECTMGGDGVMVQKQSAIPSWWNPAFQKMKASGQFKQICDASTQRHGGKMQTNSYSLLANYFQSICLEMYLSMSP